MELANIEESNRNGSIIMQPFFCMLVQVFSNVLEVGDTGCMSVRIHPSDYYLYHLPQP